MIAKGLFGLVKLKLKSWIKPLYALREEVGPRLGKHPIFEGQHSPEMFGFVFQSNGRSATRLAAKYSCHRFPFF